METEIKELIPDPPEDGNQLSRNDIAIMKTSIRCGKKSGNPIKDVLFYDKVKCQNVKKSSFKEIFLFQNGETVSNLPDKLKGICPEELLTEKVVFNMYTVNISLGFM